MNDELIQTFLTIVEKGSMSAAADAEYTTQSRISKKLQKLEGELGVQLIYRGRGVRTIELTSHGEMFLRLARQYQALHKEMMQIKTKPEICEISILPARVP